MVTRSGEEEGLSGADIALTGADRGQLLGICIRHAHDRAEARALLSEIGFPLGVAPLWATRPDEFWRDVLEQLDHGRVPMGYARLLHYLAQRFGHLPEVTELSGRYPELKTLAPLAPAPYPVAVIPGRASAARPIGPRVALAVGIVAVLALAAVIGWPRLSDAVSGRPGQSAPTATPAPGATATSATQPAPPSTSPPTASPAALEGPSPTADRVFGPGPAPRTSAPAQPSPTQPASARPAPGCLPPGQPASLVAEQADPSKGELVSFDVTAADAAYSIETQGQDRIVHIAATLQGAVPTGLRLYPLSRVDTYAGNSPDDGTRYVPRSEITQLGCQRWSFRVSPVPSTGRLPDGYELSGALMSDTARQKYVVDGTTIWGMKDTRPDGVQWTFHLRVPIG